MNRILAAVLALLPLLATLSISSAHASPTVGRETSSGFILPGDTDTYVEVFRGGELAQVFVLGAHSSDLDVYVYDEFGNLITWDSDFTDACHATWVPRYTGTFVIRVVNRGPDSNVYAIELS